MKYHTSAKDTCCDKNTGMKIKIRFFSSFLLTGKKPCRAHTIYKSFKSLASESIIPGLHSPANCAIACNIQIQRTSEVQSLKFSLKSLTQGKGMNNSVSLTFRRVHWRRNRILLLFCSEITCSQV